MVSQNSQRENFREFEEEIATSQCGTQNHCRKGLGRDSGMRVIFVKDVADGNKRTRLFLIG